MTSQAKTESLDPITVEVVRNKLDGIANEMQSTLLRSSFSPIVKEGLDASASLFTLHGETPGAGLLDPDPSRDADPGGRDGARRRFRSTAMRDGDIYILNDPYLGGTHLPDIAVIMPVFHRGTVDRDRRRHDASPGRRRHGAGLGADQRHRDLPGGPAHSAARSCATAACSTTR